MAILVDNSQVLMSAIFSHADISTVSEDMVRHIVLNCYRSYRQKFGREYGELVICQDSSPSWRHDYFENYKANRKKARKDDPQKWKIFFEIMNNIRNEIAEVFPYKNMKVSRCEADDIIAVLCRDICVREKVLILSGDKDFIQLHIHPNVVQYSPIQKKFVTNSNPSQFLKEHIVKGDASDGIPNIFSADDVFIDENKRQTPATKKRNDEVLKHLATSGRVENKYSVNWDRNDTLINLLNIPVEYQEQILTEWNIPENKTRSKILNYMIDKKLNNLMSDIGDF